MKLIVKFIVVALISLPLFSMAQNEKINDLFNKYKGEKGVSVISINSNAFEFDLSEDSDSEEFEAFMEQLEKIKIMTIENFGNKYSMKEFNQQVLNVIESDDYKLLLDAVSDNNNFKLYVLYGEERKIKEGLIVDYEDDEFNLIWVYGSMNLNDFLKSQNHLQEIH